MATATVKDGFYHVQPSTHLRLEARKYGKNTVRRCDIGRAKTHRGAVMVEAGTGFRYGIFG